MFVDFAADGDLYLLARLGARQRLVKARALPRTDTMKTRATTAINCAWAYSAAASGSTPRSMPAADAWE